jgi:hypothetical protein
MPGASDVLAVAAHGDGDRVVERRAVGTGPAGAGLADAAGVPGSWVRAPVVLCRAKTATASLKSDATCRLLTQHDFPAIQIAARPNTLQRAGK